MHLMYFTEQPMSAYSVEAGREFGATALMFLEQAPSIPWRAAGSTTNTLEHYKLAKRWVFDGIMLNEHHNAPFCMQAKCNVFGLDPRRHDQAGEAGAPRQSAAPRRQSGASRRRAGNDRHGPSPRPLVSGFVRGGGQEQLATGVNPAFIASASKKPTS